MELEETPNGFVVVAPPPPALCSTDAVATLSPRVSYPSFSFSSSHSSSTTTPTTPPHPLSFLSATPRVTLTLTSATTFTLSAPGSPHTPLLNITRAPASTSSGCLTSPPRAVSFHPPDAKPRDSVLFLRRLARGCVLWDGAEYKVVGASGEAVGGVREVTGWMWWFGWGDTVLAVDGVGEVRSRGVGCTVHGEDGAKIGEMKYVKNAGNTFELSFSEALDRNSRALVLAAIMALDLSAFAA